MPRLTHIPIARRFALAIIACAVAAIMFHGQVALALISRGDDFLTRGDLGTARAYYLRAVRFDPSLSAAVDRFVFFAIEQRTFRSLHEGLDVASAFLATNPDDVSVLADRGLCRQILKEYKGAASDFTRAAKLGRSARYYTFAGWAELRGGDRAAAVRAWNDALAIEPTYSPASGALRKVALQ